MYCSAIEVKTGSHECSNRVANEVNHNALVIAYLSNLEARKSIIEQA